MYQCLLIFLSVLFVTQVKGARWFQDGDVEFFMDGAAVIYSGLEVVIYCNSFEAALIRPKSKRRQRLLVKAFLEAKVPEPPYSILLGMTTSTVYKNEFVWLDGSFVDNSLSNWKVGHPVLDGIRDAVVAGHPHVLDNELHWISTDGLTDFSISRPSCQRPSRYVPTVAPAFRVITDAETGLVVEGSFEIDDSELQDAVGGNFFLFIIIVGGAGVLFIVLVLLLIYWFRRSHTKAKRKRAIERGEVVSDSDDYDDDDEEEEEEELPVKVTGYKMEKSVPKAKKPTPVIADVRSVATLYQVAKSRVQIMAQNTKRVSLYFHSKPTPGEARTADISVVKGLRGYRGGEES